MKSFSICNSLVPVLSIPTTSFPIFTSCISRFSLFPPRNLISPVNPSTLDLRISSIMLCPWVATVPGSAQFSLAETGSEDKDREDRAEENTSKESWRMEER